MMDGAERSSRTPPRGSRLPPASSLSDPHPVPDRPPPLQPHWHLRLRVPAPRLRPPQCVVLRTPTGTLSRRPALPGTTRDSSGFRAKAHGHGCQRSNSTKMRRIPEPSQVPLSLSSIARSCTLPSFPFLSFPQGFYPNAGSELLPARCMSNSRHGQMELPVVWRHGPPGGLLRPLFHALAALSWQWHRARAQA